MFDPLGRETGISRYVLYPPPCCYLAVFGRETGVTHSYGGILIFFLLWTMKTVPTPPLAVTRLPSATNRPGGRGGDWPSGDEGGLEVSMQVLLLGRILLFVA